MITESAVEKAISDYTKEFGAMPVLIQGPYLDICEICSMTRFIDNKEHGQYWTPLGNLVLSLRSSYSGLYVTGPNGIEGQSVEVGE